MLKEFLEAEKFYWVLKYFSVVLSNFSVALRDFFCGAERLICRELKDIFEVLSDFSGGGGGGGEGFCLGSVEFVE